MTITIDKTPHLINQNELNYLEQALQLSRSKAKNFASPLQQWNLLGLYRTVTYYRIRSQAFSGFSTTEDHVCLFHDISGFLMK